jgi:tRNA A-37 threonylcarbamoyl transferase component Bud32
MHDKPPLPEEWLRSLRTNPLAAGQVLRAGFHKTILKAQPGGAEGDALFVKVYHYAHWGFRCQAFLGRKGARHDWRMALRLRALDIATPEPRAAIMIRNAVGWPGRSVYVAEWLEAETVAERYRSMVRDSDPLDPERLRALLRQLGYFLGALHRQGVRAKDMNLGNVLVRTHDAELQELFLIDYEDIRLVRAVDPHWRRKNLAQMTAHIRKITRKDILQLCQSYASVLPLERDPEHLADDIQTLTRTVRVDRAFRLFTGRLRQARKLGHRVC